MQLHAVYNVILAVPGIKHAAAYLHSESSFHMHMHIPGYPGYLLM